jgi:hypothetical protein
MINLHTENFCDEYSLKRYIFHEESPFAPSEKKPKTNGPGDDTYSIALSSSESSSEELTQLYEDFQQCGNEKANEASEEDPILSSNDFFKILDELKQYDDFQTRISSLWNSLNSQPAEEGDDLEVKGRFSWIQDTVSSGGTPKKSMLLQLSKDIFSSTSLGEKACFQANESTNCYRVEMLEFKFDPHFEEAGTLNEDPEQFLLDMHILTTGNLSGIDWIRKGESHPGREVKKLAMKIARGLGVNRETLCDQSKIPSGYDKTDYSMKLLFSLFNYGKYPQMSWYERDGFIAMNCNNLQDSEGNLVTQDNVAYYKALEYIRAKKICDLYSKVFPSPPSKKQLLAAYRLLFPNAMSTDLLNDEKTDVSKLVSGIWKLRSSSSGKAAANHLFHYIYTKVLTASRNRSSTNQESAEWFQTLKIIDSTNIFIRNPNEEKKTSRAIRQQLLENIDAAQAQESLRSLGSL